MNQKNIFVDIDNTITKTKGQDYKQAFPIQERIHMINQLYEKGHYITYWTARGTKTGINWYELTKHQLDHWGAKYHELKMGKPAFDMLIDDKVMESSHFFTLLELSNNKI